MHNYNSKTKKISGVTGYEIGAYSITVQFRNYVKYLYTFASAGKKAIEVMKKLAIKNEGLSTYISQNKPRYESVTYA